MLKNILKGMVIGIASIMPGVSGGTLAISMGIYDRLIACISHPFRDLKNNILFLIPIALGMGVAVIASAFGIDYLFEAFPFQTNLLFVGLILGGVPAVYEKVKAHTMRVGHIFVTTLFFIMVIGVAMMNGIQGGYTQLELSFIEVIKLFFLGVLASATMVIPGVSGSMILLMLGYYNPILDCIKEFMVALVRLDFVAIWKPVGILLPFGVGILIGTVVIAKIIEMVFKNFPVYAYWSILGLLFASPIAILLVGNFATINIFTIVSGILSLGLGFFVSNCLGEK